LNGTIRTSAADIACTPSRGNCKSSN